MLLLRSLLARPLSALSRVTECSALRSALPRRVTRAFASEVPPAASVPKPEAAKPADSAAGATTPAAGTAAAAAAGATTPGASPASSAASADAAAQAAAAAAEASAAQAAFERRSAFDEVTVREGASQDSIESMEKIRARQIDWDYGYEATSNWFWAVVGVGLLVYPAYKTYESFNSQNWPSVPGKVQLSHAYKAVGQRIVTEEARIVYSYMVNDKVFTGHVVRLTRDNNEADLREFVRGANVTVYYDPKDPSHACLKPGFATEDLQKELLMAVGGVVSLLVYAGLKLRGR